MKNYRRKKRVVRFIKFYNKCKFLPGSIDVKELRRRTVHETLEGTLSEIMYLMYTTPPAELENLRPLIRTKLDYVASVYVQKGFERYKQALADLHSELLKDPRPLEYK